jgi:hypothetical protein
MRTLRHLLLGIFCLPLIMMAQSEAYRMVELSYMKAKPGMYSKFEAAVKAHNEKYHKEGKYGSALYSIVTGNEAGWYVWTMGPCTFTDLDGRPAAGAHEDDWNKTIEPLIAEYGRTEYWKWNDKMSFRVENDNKMIQLWWVDITKGEYYRFKAFMEKIKAVHEKQNDAISVYDNQFNQNDGRDVVIVWSMENWASMDKDDWKMKTEFEAMYGEGSWELAIEEWKDVVNSRVEEVWKEL